MLSFYLNAQTTSPQKVKFYGALSGGYAYRKGIAWNDQQSNQHQWQGGSMGAVNLELGASINLNPPFFITPIASFGYAKAYSEKDGANVLSGQIIMKIGGGKNNFSGYGIIGGGITGIMVFKNEKSSHPSSHEGSGVKGCFTFGAGAEYRYKYVGFFAEITAPVVFKESANENAHIGFRSVVGISLHTSFKRSVLTLLQNTAPLIH